jgi:hypothetical protein
LVAIKEGREFVATRESAFLFDVGAIDPDGLKGHFHTKLKCSNNQCGEEVISIGEYFVTEDRDHPDYQHEHYKTMVRPYYFLPAIPVFKIPEKTPDKIENAIKQSFSHAFTDPAAAGNALRRVVERILDSKRIVRSKKVTKKGNTKRINLSLHERINVWKPNSNGLADHLMAIKWIGNIASHEEEISFDSVFHAFEIIEHVIEAIYSDKVMVLKKRVAQINRRKGKL